MSPPSFRAFGQAAADLEIDFAGLPRPHLVTRIVAACAVPEMPAAACRGLTTGERIASLLRIGVRGGTSALPVWLVCTAADCGEPLEVDLPIDDLLRLHEETSGVERIHVGMAGLTLRRPTGADQAAWWERGCDDEAAALRTMVGTLLVEPAPDGWPDEADLAGAAEELSQIDPLVGFHVAVACPECGREQSHPVDLQELVLVILRRAQQTLFEEVHRLARAYHWSEGQIVALPAWRRSRYLALIERGEGR